MKCWQHMHDGDNGRGKLNIWQLTRNSAGSEQDLAKQNEQSEKYGERWDEGGQWCFWKAALTGLTELKFWGHLPENERETPPPPNDPAVDLIKTMTWNNGEGEREKREKSGWRACLIFSSPLSPRATGPSKRRRTDRSVFSGILFIFKLHCGATSLWDAKTKKKLMRNRLKS